MVDLDLMCVFFYHPEGYTRSERTAFNKSSSGKNVSFLHSIKVSFIFCFLLGEGIFHRYIYINILNLINRMKADFIVLKIFISFCQFSGYFKDDFLWTIFIYPYNIH